MKYMVSIMGKSIPGYSLSILCGVIIANVAAVYNIKKQRLDINDFLIIEAYLIMGGALGAKLLYLAVNIKRIEVARLGEIEYISSLVRGGFVFYGGLIGAFAGVAICTKLHNIKTGKYLKHNVYLFPLVHAFGRVGCFMAGCCYGVPYSGILSVRFPTDSLAASGMSLFPVQLLEAFVLALISLCLFILRHRLEFQAELKCYLIMYAVMRFFIEFLRADNARGSWLMLSTSQWISVGIFVVMTLCQNKNKLK